MATLVKICGIRDEAALTAAIEAGAGMVGMVFFPASPRNIDFSVAAALAAKIPAHVTAVALTVDADNALLDTIAAQVSPGMIQAHGGETPERMAEIAARTGLKTMKVLPVFGRQDIAKAKHYEPVVDWMLFDARPPKGASRPGGHGAPFDWSLMAGVTLSRPWLLAGGLTPQNVGEAVRLSGATGVDVSSGVEHTLGVKDIGLIREFVAAAQGRRHARGPVRSAYDH
ncbi:MAG: phosphoribosylanthranilate isomerase [Alphaproteobacteria bacterium]